jgi:hypothetical protein
MNPDEIAACIQLNPQPGEPQRVPGKFGLAGDISASWIFEARAYPRLCHWLETEAHWMLDPKDPDQVAEASLRLWDDEDASGGEPQFMTVGVSQGLRNRLKMVPVCGTCLCIYNVIHAAIVGIKRQRGDKWASRQQRLRRKREELQLEKELFAERRGDGKYFNVISAYPPVQTSVLGDTLAELFRDMSPRSELSARSKLQLSGASSPGSRSCRSSPVTSFRRLRLATAP